MRMYDIIARKRDGGVLSDEEIGYFTERYNSGEIPDYQAAALLMALFLKGMNEEEMTALTMALARSGKMLDLSGIPGIKVDKHSTGGVGDKTTMIVMPIVASCGVPVAKMSGRGLGHTGGTVDKLESIEGYRVALSEAEMVRQVGEIGIALVGQSEELCPCDKKLYALRDVTATVESIPLIASSVMSKKIASGADKILLDVKVGSGAFVKTLEEGVALARAMIRIGTLAGRETAALLSDMSVPLGNAVGNALEVGEAVAALKGNGPFDLTETCLALAGHILVLGGAAAGQEEGERLAASKIRSGEAYRKFTELVQRQGGRLREDGRPALKGSAPFSELYAAPEDGYVTRMDVERIGRASLILGAGREKKEDPIEYGAGIIFSKKTGAAVRKGETIACLMSADREKLGEAAALLGEAVAFGKEPPPAPRHLLGFVSRDGADLY